MPNWGEIGEEIQGTRSGSPFDIVRRKYLEKVSKFSGRNVIAYYSCFVQRPDSPHRSINDEDMNGFMTTIDKMDRTKGLDLILHTPGGDLAATESIVKYLKVMFNDDIRAIIPQIAMSAGTMIACACKEIIMGKQSNLGPIDPQFRGISASGIIEEFEQAQREINDNPKNVGKIVAWQTILSKYNPTFIGDCDKAVKWSEEMVTKWLTENMFKDDNDNNECAKKIVNYLGSHSETKSHSRHIGINDCKNIGLKINDLEKIKGDGDYQDFVLSLHHAYMHTLSGTNATKIIENQSGAAFIQMVNPNSLNR